MKLQLTIASFTICLLFSPMLRAQESPRIVSYDLTVQIDVPNRQVEVGGSFEVDFHDSDSISLVLWRHARIDTLPLSKSPLGCITFSAVMHFFS